MAGSVINTDNAPAAIGPYNQAVVAGGFIFVSGQVGIDPATGNLVSESVDEQTGQAFRNLGAVLAAAGAGMESVVKITCFLDDMGDFQSLNEVYATFFTGDYPARSCFEVSKLPKGAKVELEAVALAP
jgi:2-iminobutanoate/2-iminopropanoate deaminase